MPMVSGAGSTWNLPEFVHSSAASMEIQEIDFVEIIPDSRGAPD
jgi:hypothetical protein